MTSTVDLDVVKMYQDTKNEVSVSTGSKVVAETDRQTHTQTDTHTHYENITSTAYTGGKDRANGIICLHVRKLNGIRPGNCRRIHTGQLII